MKQASQNQQQYSGKTYAWKPPVASNDEQVPTLPPTAEVIPTFDKTLKQIDAACSLLAGAGPESPPGTEHINDKHPKLTKIPDPRSNFEHHPEPPPQDDEYKKLPLKEREAIDQAFVKGLDLKGQEAYQRLKLAFEWLVCRTSALMGDINKAVKANDVPAYRLAWDAYMAFVNNLANPKPGAQDIDPKKGFGYGLDFVWTSIDACIPPDPSGVNVITGARIQGEWNPHTSSSGIPIP
ncbi:MAG TPA: hypothetical protein VL361_09030 [Candidatus Limnocylindrales bacterium]|jgi:hypothetical protein|nr:hypothetical protein [Candidatus Limnocylindrales bacterium]